MTLSRTKGDILHKKETWRMFGKIIKTRQQNEMKSSEDVDQWPSMRNMRVVASDLNPSRSVKLRNKVRVLAINLR